MKFEASYMPLTSSQVARSSSFRPAAQQMRKSVLKYQKTWKALWSPPKILSSDKRSLYRNQTLL